MRKPGRTEVGRLSRFLLPATPPKERRRLQPREGTRKDGSQGDVVGAAELSFLTVFATASTTPPDESTQGSWHDDVDVADFTFVTNFAPTPTPPIATAETSLRTPTAEGVTGTPCVAPVLLPPTLMKATHDVPNIREGTWEPGEMR